MHFLFVVTDFSMGGITTSLKNLTDELIRHGHRVSFLNLSNATDFPVVFHPDITFIPVNGCARYWNVGMLDYQRTKGFRKMALLIFGLCKKVLSKIGIWHRVIFSSIPKLECDVAIAYRQSSDSYYIISQKTTANRTIAFIHSELTGDTSGWLPPLKHIDKIACVSDDWSNDFRRRFPEYADKVGTVYNMFDADDIRLKAEQRASEYNQNVFNIVTVARIDTPQKKIETIPAICDKIRKKTNRQFKWYVVGDGPDRPLVEAAVQSTKTGDCFELLGAKKNPYPYIKNADLFVLTSSWESYGMVIQESLICGTPVVAGDYPALHEIIKDPREGIIAENSIEGIAEAVLSLMNNRDKYDEMKQHLNHYKYSPDVAYEQIMEMCE